MSISVNGESSYSHKLLQDEEMTQNGQQKPFVNKIHKNKTMLLCAEIADDISSGESVDPFYRHGNLKRSSLIEDLPPTVERSEAKVLVLFTGGTIGMKRDKQHNVYVPFSGLMEESLRNMPSLHDKDYAEKYFSHQNPPPLVLPDTGDRRRVIYTVYEYDPLLDSSNMTINDWVRIGIDINKFYHSADGFVVLHGTDTMSYTASALSFMLENLGKPVILTGSQIPIYEPRSDGQSNFLVSLILAGNYQIPEVTLYFNHKLFRGNTTVKVNSEEFDAFDSPNFPPLVKVGVKIQVDWSLVFRSSNIEKFTVQTSLNRNVAVLRIFPSISTEAVRALLRPPLQGVVLQTYGNGNIPSNRIDLLDELKKASNSGIIIVNITQCVKGCVQLDYETGKVLHDCGVLCGFNMTPEAALTKLSYVLAKDISLETKRKMMSTNIRGEMNYCKASIIDQPDFLDALRHELKTSASPAVNRIKDFVLASVVCAAAKQGDVHVMELLQQYGCELTSNDYDYRTPLHVAASEGQIEMVKYLLTQGANVHARDRNERTPLEDAVDANHQSVIVMLLQAGAKFPKHSPNFGEKLCRAAATGKLLTLQSYHLAGAWLNQPDYSGRTALQMAKMFNRTECIHFLLDNESDLNGKN